MQECPATSTPPPETMIKEVDVESQPTSALNRSSAPSLKEQISKHLSSKIETAAGYAPLLVCCFATGLTDGTVYIACGTFVSMQTGNTIFVALGTTGQNNKPYSWVRSLCSIGCFAIGCITFARLHKLIGGSRLRRTVVFSFFLQTVCVVIATAVIQSGIIDDRYPPLDPNRVNFTDLAAVALLSFQAAGQIVNSRGLGVGEVPTVVITSLVCDLMSDEHLFTGLKNNGKRNRRFIAFVLALLGAIGGGWISKSTRSIGPSLWLVAGIKAVITLYWLGIVPWKILLLGRG